MADRVHGKMQRGTVHAHLVTAVSFLTLHPPLTHCSPTDHRCVIVA